MRKRQKRWVVEKFYFQLYGGYMNRKSYRALLKIIVLYVLYDCMSVTRQF